MRHCSLCNREVNEDEAPILTMGGFGNPRYLCEECSSDIELAVRAKEPEAIESAMERISSKISAINTDDSLVIETVKSIFEEAGSRAKKIREGTYDFSADEEQNDGESEEVPEQLRETEDDRRLDEKEKKQTQKFDKIFNLVAIGVFAAAIIVMAIFWLIR